MRELNAWYGESHVLHGVDFDIAAGEVVTLLGRNGAGKTTTLRSIMGIVPRREGSIVFEGQRDRRARLQPDRAARHRVLSGGARHLREPRTSRRTCCCRRRSREGGLSVEQIFELFPNLKERLRSQGTKLSGGEQQMLAIGRILRTGARLLLLDEPTEGLAPVIVQQIGRTIARLKAQGFTILLVEQNFRFAATVADRHYVMDHGRVVDMIPEFGARRRTWTSCTSISASERRRSNPQPARRHCHETGVPLPFNHGETMKSFKRTVVGSRGRRRVGGRRRAGAGLGQRRQDRRAVRHVEPVHRSRRRRLGASRRGWPSRTPASRSAGSRSRSSRRTTRTSRTSASGIARQWYDVDKVDVIVDTPNSGVALAVNQITRRRARRSSCPARRRRTSPARPARRTRSIGPTTRGCSPTAPAARSSRPAAIVVLPDRRLCVRPRARARHRGGRAQEPAARCWARCAQPLNTQDFSSFLLQAQASKAKIIGLANAGGDTTNSIKQAAEFGIVKGGQNLAGLLVFLTDIHALGLPTAQGLVVTETFYWDTNDQTRAFAKRFAAVDKGIHPTMVHAGVYSAVLHYLKAVEALKSDDGTKVIAQDEGNSRPTIRCSARARSAPTAARSTRRIWSK